MAYIGNSPDTIQRGRRFIYEFTATAGQTVFSGADDNNQTLDLLEANEQSVFLNGVRLIPTDDYTVSGDTLTLTSAASLNDFLVVETQAEVANTSTYTRAESDARYVNYNGDIISGDLQITGNVSVASGNMSFGDNDKVILGAGNDLQIYHDGSNSYVKEAGVGNLYINGENHIFLTNSAGTQTYAAFNGPTGWAKLYFSGSEKLSTVSGGIDVTGTVTADGLTVDGTADVDNLVIDNAGKISSLGQIELQVDTDNNQSGTYIGFSRNNTTSERLALFLENGDISFYEATGTTPKFFWDASAERLGIGTSTVDSLLHLSKNDATAYSATATDGQVGVGPTIYLENTANANTTVGGQIVFGMRSTEEQARIAATGGTAPALTFGTADAERMRIDSSGNLLVSTTGSTPATGTNTGIALKSNDTIEVGTSGGAPLLLNRTSNDGNIAMFRKDGSTVGSIGSNSTKLTIGGTATYDPRLRFGQTNNLATVQPADNTGALADDTVNFGQPNYRFKDLYLSGGVYVGGTGSANYLDDYEEGTWTPTLTYQTAGTLSVSYNTRMGRYTKVGNMVTIHWAIRLSAFSKGTASGSLIITGIPFAGELDGPIGTLGLYNSSFSGIPVSKVSPSNIGLLSMTSNGAWSGLADADANAQYFGTAVYQTAS